MSKLQQEATDHGEEDLEATKSSSFCPGEGKDGGLGLGTDKLDSNKLAFPRAGSTVNNNLHPHIQQSFAGVAQHDLARVCSDPHRQSWLA